MSSTLQAAAEHLLAPGDLDERALSRTLDSLLAHRVDLADLYFQSTRAESWVLEDGIVKEGSHSIEQGVGVRAVCGEKTGFAYSDEIVLPALTQAAEAARAIAASGASGGVQVFKPAGSLDLYRPRDPIDTLLEWEGKTYQLIDTAGIRRRSQVSGVAEGIAVLFARRQLERADLAILVIDASRGVTSGDLAIAGLAWEMGRGIVVALNKWDLLDEEGREHLEETWLRLEEVTGRPPRVNISALTGRRLDRLLPEVDRALERFRLELSTSEVNRILERAVAQHQAPQVRHRPWRLFYATQVTTAPPTFMLFANRTLEKESTYRRYLENRLRDELDLSGIPLRLVVRQR